MVIICFLRSWCRANLDDKRTLKCNPTKHQLTFQNFFILGLTSGKNSQYDNHMCWAFSEPTKFAEIVWNSDWLEWRQRNSRFLLNCHSHPNYRPPKKSFGNVPFRKKTFLVLNGFTFWFVSMSFCTLRKLSAHVEFVTGTTSSASENIFV